MNISFKKYTLKLHHTFLVSGAKAKDELTVGYIQVTSDFATGFGEASPSNFWNEDIELVEEAVSQLDLAHFANPLLYEIILQNTQETLKPPKALCAALDMALFDAVGKMLNVPLYRFLGFSELPGLTTSFTIGLDDLDMIEKKTVEAEEYPILKIKLGTAYDIEMIERIRKITDKPIRIDVNEGWEREEAVEKIRWLETQNVELIEQPLRHDHIEDNLWVKERVNLPIIADESVQTAEDIPHVAPYFDGVNVKLQKCGGILNAIRMIREAKQANLSVMLGCMTESSVGIAAALHLSPLADYLDLDGHLLIKNDPFKGILYKNGRLIPEERPGLGVEPIKSDFFD